jgi:hypothetical protein
LYAYSACDADGLARLLEQHIVAVGDDLVRIAATDLKQESA